MRRWRGLTVMTGALAACVVGIVLAREYRPDALPPDWRPKQQVVERVVEKPVEVVREVVREVPSARPAQFVAVFQKDEQSPAFLMSVDTDKRTVTVRQVAAERLADKSYQLWIATAAGRGAAVARRARRPTTSPCRRRSPPTIRRSSTMRPSGFRWSRSAARRPASRPAR